jgi:hypothetical protein
MNERIKELIEECTDRHFSECVGGFETFDKEKFAELVVGECSGIVQNYMSRWPEDCDLVIKIKEHFGVEE